MKFFAKYPFLKGAQASVKEKGIALKLLLEDMAYEPAKVRGKERIAEAIDRGAVENRPVISEPEQLAEILSYPISRMIISCAADGFLISRYALGEAMLLESRLIDENDDNLKSIAEELGVELRKNDTGYLIHFTEFLTATASIRAKEWKLINQEIFKGMVKISKEKLARILRQKLNDKINSELPLEVTDDIIAVFGGSAKRFSGQMAGKRKKFDEGELGPVDDASFPPCMKTIITMIRNGENAPHSARFAITSFLHALGMNADMIIKAFSTAPDFDASKSEYQVRHIIGEISGIEYSPPECSTMKSYGICYNPDGLCERESMTHPLKYYRNMKKKRGSRKSTPRPDKSLDSGEIRGDNEKDEQKVEQG